MATNVKFKQGDYSKLPSNSEDGTLYLAKNGEEAYLYYGDSEKIIPIVDGNKKTFTLSSLEEGWYRIAETKDKVQKCTGLFSILAKKTMGEYNYHTSCNFYATTTYGLQNHINILSNSNYGNTQAISKIRIVYPNDYSAKINGKAVKAYLEMYITINDSIDINISLIKNSGWNLYPSILHETLDTTNYSTKEISIVPNYLSFTSGLALNNNIKLSLNTIKGETLSSEKNKLLEFVDNLNNTGASHRHGLIYNYVNANNTTALELKAYQNCEGSNKNISFNLVYPYPKDEEGNFIDEVPYAKLNIGYLQVPRLVITNTNDVNHLEFSRSGLNYITAPDNNSSIGFCFSKDVLENNDCSYIVNSDENIFNKKIYSKKNIYINNTIEKGASIDDDSLYERFISFGDSSEDTSRLHRYGMVYNSVQKGKNTMGLFCYKDLTSTNSDDHTNINFKLIYQPGSSSTKSYISYAQLSTGRLRVPKLKISSNTSPTVTTLETEFMADELLNVEGNILSIDSNISQRDIIARNSLGGIKILVGTTGNRGLSRIYTETDEQGKKVDKTAWMLYYNETNDRQEQVTTYFTGTPYLSNGGDYQSHLSFKPDRFSNSIGFIRYCTKETGDDKPRKGQFQFYQYGYSVNEDNKGDTRKDDIWDCFYFPNTNPVSSNATENKSSYKILTTKELVTISQGGTGKDKWENKQIVFGNNSGGLSQNDAIQVNTSENFGSLWLGNDNDTGNKYGAIRIYDTAKHYNLIKTVDSMSANRITRLRDWGSDGYLVATNTTNAVGNTDTPVYVDNNGIINPIEILSVEHGGTGQTTLTSGYALIGNGPNAVTLRAITNNTSKTAVTASTNLITANTLYYHSGNSNLTTVGTITTGTWNATTIGVAYGGTGKTTHTLNSVLIGNETSAVKNVATASGAFYATSANGAPQFGTLPVGQGGTGCDDGTDAANYFINQLPEGTTAPIDNAYYISEYSGTDSTKDNKYYRRKHSDLYTYIKGKINVSNKNTTLEWSKNSTIATIAGTNITITMPANPNTDESVYQSQETKTVYRPLLMHCNYSAAYGGNPGNATDQVYYNETIAACPGKSQLIAKEFAVASSNNNRGLYDLTRGTWMLYYNKTNERQEQKSTYFTETLYLSNNGDYQSHLSFKPDRFSETAGFIRYATRTASDETRKGQFQFYQYGYSIGEKTDTRSENGWDCFILPKTETSKTTSNTYSILTTKNTVTVDQGGTGANTKAGARNNLIYIGANPITSTGDDISTNWSALGCGIAYYNKQDQLNGQPYQYGLLINATNGTGYMSGQLFLASGGDAWIRSCGNSSGKFNSWERILSTRMVKYGNASDRPSSPAVGTIFFQIV